MTIFKIKKEMTISYPNRDYYFHPIIKYPNMDKLSFYYFHPIIKYDKISKKIFSKY